MKGKALNLAASLRFGKKTCIRHGKDVQYVNDVTCIATVKQTVAQNCFTCRFAKDHCPWLPRERAGSDTQEISNHQGCFRISTYIMDIFLNK